MHVSTLCNQWAKGQDKLKYLKVFQHPQYPKHLLALMKVLFPQLCNQRDIIFCCILPCFKYWYSCFPVQQSACCSYQLPGTRVDTAAAQSLAKWYFKLAEELMNIHNHSPMIQLGYHETATCCVFLYNRMSSVIETSCTHKGHLL